MILSLHGDSHPLTAKYTQNQVEAYNLRPESDDRTKLLMSICEKNYDIAKDTFGEKSIFTVRPLYTLYTASLHEESNKSEEAMVRMASLVLNGEPVRANQFLFKAILLDTILLMQS